MRPLRRIILLALAGVPIVWALVVLGGRASAVPSTGAAATSRPSSRPTAPRGRGPVEVEPNRPFVHEPTGFVFPPTVGSFRRIRVAQLDEIGRGVMVRYKDPDLKIALTIAVYPGGGVALRPHFDAMKASLLRVQPKARLTAEGKWMLHQADAADVAGMRMTYEYIAMLDGVEQDLEAQACLVPLAAGGGGGGSYVRYDAIYPAADAKAARGRVGRFIEVLKLP